MFARIDSLRRHYSFSPLYRLHDLFLDYFSMDIDLYRNDLFSLIRNIAQGACLIFYSEFVVFFSYPIVNSILCHLR